MDFEDGGALCVEDGARVEDVTLVNAPDRSLNITGCDHMEVDCISVYVYRENSDGIDIVSSTDVRVHDCFLRTGDAAAVVKAMMPPPRTGGRDIRCERCAAWNDKVRCFGIAAESVNDISDVYFGNCDVIRSYADWTLELGALVVYICDCALVERVAFENIRIEHKKHLGAHVMITKDFWSKTKAAGNIRNVEFRNISLPRGVQCRIAGYDAEHTVRGYALSTLNAEVSRRRRWRMREFRFAIMLMTLLCVDIRPYENTPSGRVISAVTTFWPNEAFAQFLLLA